MAQKAQIFETLLAGLRFDGADLSGGKVYFYEPGTETPRAVYVDRDKTTEAANPYTLDANGQAEVFGDGVYDIKVTTAAGVQKAFWEKVALRDSGFLNVAYSEDYASINAAITAIGATPTTLYINAAMPATGNFTVPKTLEIVINNAGSINQGAFTGTINGPFSCPLNHQGFTGSGAITFAMSSVPYAVPQWFGALADDTNDDTAAIQSAIDSHRTVFLPRGIYKITSELTSSVGGQHIYGERSNVSGQGSWIHQVNAAYNLTVSGTGVQANQYTEINNITFTGSTALGIGTQYTEHLNVHDCSFSGTVYGLRMSIDANEQDVKPFIHHNVFAGNTYGVYSGDTRWADGWIQDNTFVNVTNVAIRIGYMDGGFIERNFIGNDLDSSTENNGIIASKATWATIRENQLFEVNGNGIVANGAKYSEISGNRFVKTGKSNNKTALSMGQYSVGNDVRNVNVSGNMFADTYGAAISIGNAYDSILSGNNIIGAGYTGTTRDAISIVTSDRITLRGNKVDGDSYTDGTQDTRYWLSINTVTDLILDGNEEKNSINDGTVALGGTNTVKVHPNNKTRSITAGTVSQQAMDDIFICDATGGAIVINLQSAAVFKEKRLTFIKTDASANTVTIDPTSTQTINGAATPALSAQYQRMVIVSNGANWFIESAN